MFLARIVSSGSRLRCYCHLIHSHVPNHCVTTLSGAKPATNINQDKSNARAKVTRSSNVVIRDDRLDVRASIDGMEMYSKVVPLNHLGVRAGVSRCYSVNIHIIIISISHSTSMELEFAFLWCLSGGAR